MKSYSKTDKNIKIGVEMLDECYIMLYLVFCQIKGQEINRNVLENVSPETLYKVSNYHGVTPMIYDSVKDLEVFQDSIMKFKEVREKSIRKNMMMDIERQKLYEFMDKKNIWHVSLKGIVLKEYYPKAGQRQMADNDILYDKNYQQDVRDWFVKQGYKVKRYGKYHHDVYEKPPIYNFEMHNELFSELHRPVMKKYYDNIQTKLILKHGCEYMLSNEEFYLYFFAHAYKHFDGSGTGIKFLTDLALFLNKNSNSMNWDYIGTELIKLQMKDFECESKKLIGTVISAMDMMKEDGATIQIFKNRILEEENQMIHILFRSGQYGTLQNNVQKKVNAYKKGSVRSKKIRYCVKRLFPNQKFMTTYYHPIGKYKICIPFLWLYRIIKGLICQHQKLGAEIRILKKM